MEAGMEAGGSQGGREAGRQPMEAGMEAGDSQGGRQGGMQGRLLSLGRRRRKDKGKIQYVTLPTFISPLCIMTREGKISTLHHDQGSKISFAT